MNFHGYFSPATIAPATARPISSRFMVSLFRTSSNKKENWGRRAIFSFLVAAAALPQSNASKNALLQEYLKKSRENKAKNDKKRLDDYYSRNYKDYFELIEGSSKDKGEDLLSETEKEIRRWLQRNKK